MTSLDQMGEDSGIVGLCGIAAYFRIPADANALRHELALSGDMRAQPHQLVGAAKSIGLKAAVDVLPSSEDFVHLTAPSLLRLRDNSFVVFGGRYPDGQLRIIDPVNRREQRLTREELLALLDLTVIRVARRFLGSGHDPDRFGLSWFLPIIWRYRRPLCHVMIASLFIQCFALITPLFFQVIIDKILVHQSYYTLIILSVGLVTVGLFDVILQYLRAYALNHTTNRIDVELGKELFQHLLKLPIGYFETRSAGQTVARIRELESIRTFLTGQGLFAGLDFLFTFVFVAVLFAYSPRLTLIVLASIPLFLILGLLLRPLLRQRIKEKFDRGAISQQFLVESVIGMETIKAAAVEPIVQNEWEDRLAAYVATSFDATMLATVGQNAIQYISKLSTVLILFFGARQVMDNELTVGQLIAFNMIAGQVAQPILRISQIFQDFQQVQVSIDRLGDILNTQPERTPRLRSAPPPPSGAIQFRNVSFRYRPSMPEVLKQVSLDIRSGQVIGIVGPSGSGKSTLSKMLQRFYLPDEGQILMDGVDLTQCDPAWLRSHIGVVLQENLLFNRTIHENIALARPAMPRAQVVAVSRLAAADDFIGKLPEGYDTLLEERGANLSGGQRQRLAIARALATNPRILIFDEATSALDYESERLIQANMRQIVRGRTVILITHRLSTVRHADCIIGMQEGRIVETGTHSELVKRPDSLYARLWALQNEGSGA